MRSSFWVRGLFIAALAVFPWLGLPVYFSSLLFTVFLFVTLAESWNIIGGMTGYLSFGHVAFLGVGAYTTAMLASVFKLAPLAVFLTALPAGLAAAGLAAVVGYPCLRLRGPYFAVITLCLAFVVELAVKNLDFLGGPEGLWLKESKLNVAMDRAIFYEVMLGVALLVVLTVAWIGRSRWGAGLRAIKEDEDVALAVGINAASLKLRAFVVSAFFPGVAGGIYAFYLSYIHPDIVFDVNISIIIVLMAIFGGWRHWSGPVLGAIILTLVNAALSTFIKAEYARIIYGLLFMGVILYLPDGLTAWWEERRARAPGVI
jgi:branched-chain amino acid transport system permease protein